MMKTEDKKTPLDISEVKIRLMKQDDDGLLGWASCIVNDALYINNIAIRRSQAGDLVLSYPAQRSSREKKYFYFHPISRDAQCAIDEAILGKLQVR